MHGGLRVTHHTRSQFRMSACACMCRHTVTIKNCRSTCFVLFCSTSRGEGPGIGQSVGCAGCSGKIRASGWYVVLVARTGRDVLRTPIPAECTRSTWYVIGVWVCGCGFARMHVQDVRAEQGYVVTDKITDPSTQTAESICHVLPEQCQQHLELGCWHCHSWVLRRRMWLPLQRPVLWL